MDRIDTLRVFVRIVERGSFVRAAEDLDLPASTVTDAIKRLEARLKVRLLNRTTRQVRPTLDGEAYYQRCLGILADFDEAESAFTGGVPRGYLRVEVQGTQARRVLLPALPRFFATYPEIELFLSEGERYADPIREGIDCMLRVGRPGDADLVARRIATLSEVTVASPGYIARHGHPARWDALDGHRMVGFRSSATGSVLPLEFVVDGVCRNVTLPASLTVNGAETYRAAAQQGLGLIQVPRYGVEQNLRDGSLVEVLAETPPTPTPVFLVYPQIRQLTLRLRVFIDWVTQEFAARG